MNIELLDVIYKPKLCKFLDNIYSINISSDKSISLLALIGQIFYYYLDGNQNLGLWVIGGSICDLILEFPIKDIDLATNMEPNMMVEAFEWFLSLDSCQIKEIFGIELDDEIIRKISILEKINKNSLKNGTFNLYYSDDNIRPQFRHLEITSLRTEDGQRGQHKIKFIGLDIAKEKAILEDCFRRDLTIGIGHFEIAYLSDSNGCDGSFLTSMTVNKEFLSQIYSDIYNRHITFVGDIQLRIWEDSLRILRYLRKICKYKGRYEPLELKYLLDNLDFLSSEITIRDEMISRPVAHERIIGNNGELTKILSSDCQELFSEIKKIGGKVFVIWIPPNFNLSRLLDSDWNTRIDNFDWIHRWASLFLDENGMIVDGGMEIIKSINLISDSAIGHHRYYLIFLILISDYWSRRGWKKNDVNRWLLFQFDGGLEEFAKEYQIEKSKIMIDKVTKIGNFWNLDISRIELIKNSLLEHQEKINQIRKKYFTHKNFASLEKSDKNKKAILEISELFTKKIA